MPAVHVGERTTLEIRSSFEALPPAVDAATAWLTERQRSPADIWFVTLVLDELVSNCVRHGYADSREHVITVELLIADGRLTVTVVDDGRPFNPLDVPEPDLSADIDERKIGGLGIHLLRTVADSMTYERSGDRNRVVLVRRL